MKAAGMPAAESALTTMVADAECPSTDAVTVVEPGLTAVIRAVSVPVEATVAIAGALDVELTCLPKLATPLASSTAAVTTIELSSGMVVCAGVTVRPEIAANDGDDGNVLRAESHAVITTATAVPSNASVALLAADLMAGLVNGGRAPLNCTANHPIHSTIDERHHEFLISISGAVTNARREC
jgi:hypothetical protein